jgi:uncharacterized protein (TIGR03546 family)
VPIGRKRERLSGLSAGNSIAEASRAMLLYLIKRLFNLKQAIFGRNQPGQLAWGFALGILLGLVPSSSLIAALILTLVCCLKVNHGMAGVTALVTTLVAAKLDPYSHAVGMKLLEHPQLIGAWAFVWQLPGVPWMSINNTVVLGSLVLGLVSVGPTYFVSYPIFRRLAPKERPIVTQPEGVATSQQADEIIAPLPANARRIGDGGKRVDTCGDGGGDEDRIGRRVRSDPATDR